MFRIYRATVDHHPWGRRYLNGEFFELLRERFKHRLCFVLAWRGEEHLAGTENVA
jgi:predicted N-acyltransferase